MRNRLNGDIASPLFSVERTVTVKSMLEKLIRARAGAAALEFALVLPLLLTLMLGTVQAGMMVFTYNAMVSAARDQARALAVCSVGQAEAKTNALAELASIIWVPPTSFGVSATAAAPDVSVTITVPTAKAMILNYVPFAPPSLTTTVTMEMEPLAFGGGTCGGA